MATELQTRDTMSEESFDRMMRTGLQQAKTGDSMDADAFFEQMEQRIQQKERFMQGIA